jgi:hypothetical protein
MPVILVIMVASAGPKDGGDLCVDLAELPVELKHCWVRRAISGVLLSSRKTLTARAICNAMAEHRGATGLPLTVWRSKGRSVLCSGKAKRSSRNGLARHAESEICQHGRAECRAVGWWCCGSPA